MTDIFREIEEEVRRERYAQLWNKYGHYVLAVVAVIVLSIAGWQLWARYDQNGRAKASAAYIAAQHIPDAKQSAEAFAKLATTAPSGYATVARLQEANAMLAAGDHDQAVALYTKLMNNADEPIASVARLRAAWAQADTATRADVEKQLAPLTDPTNPWQFMAREILAYMDYRLGKPAAETEFRRIADASDAPAGIRARAGQMADFLAAGGGRDVGVVPPLKPDATKLPAEPAAKNSPAPKQ